MVLRKPYKFLIKHFRFIHLILAIASIYLLIKTNGIMNFFNGYLNNNETLIGTGTVNEYFNGLMTIFIILVLLGTIIIGIIMKMKDKPIVLYIINLIAYIFISIILIYDKSLIETLELSVLDIRTIKLASDLTLICFLVQTISTIMLSIRAVGFDIKKFDFGKDIEFEIDEKDNEEFEFEVAVDKNKIKRNIKKNIRSIKYTYHENKFIINIFIVLALIITGVIIYLNKEVYNKIYKQNETITTPQFTYVLEESYITNKNYKKNQITDNYLVITKLKIKVNGQEKMKFKTASTLLQIGKVTYNPTTKYKNELIDLGVDVENKNITTEFEEYILTFEIPKQDISEKMILSYNDINNKKYKIKLNNIDIDEKTNSVQSKLTEKMVLNDKLLKNIEFKINNYEINNKIKATYNFCETKEICYQSYEYIVPSLTDNYEKVILKIESEMNFNDTKIKNFNDLSDFIENYGTIKYIKNGVSKEMNTSIKEIQPQKSNYEGVYYFEIYKEIIDADEIYLIINIREKRYEYKIK